MSQMFTDVTSEINIIIVLILIQSAEVNLHKTKQILLYINKWFVITAFLNFMALLAVTRLVI